jgi:hypothetical protein
VTAEPSCDALCGVNAQVDLQAGDERAKAGRI